jgi:hypothetical protein
VQQACPSWLLFRGPSWLFFRQHRQHNTLPHNVLFAQALTVCCVQGVSLQQRVDPFSGAATGTAAASRTNAAEDASPWGRPGVMLPVA